MTARIGSKLHMKHRPFGGKSGDPQDRHHATGALDNVHRRPRKLKSAEPDLWPLRYFRKHQPAIADALRHPTEDLVLARVVQRGSYSAVLKVYSKQWQQYVAVKICFDPASHRPNRKRSSDEYAALAACSQMTRPDAECRLVRPIAHIPSLAILVLEWLDGESALWWLDRSRSREQRLHLFFDLGRWLAQFHRQNGISSRAISKSALLRARTLSPNPALMAPFRSMYRRYRRKIVQLVQESDPLVCHSADLHGDYHLENIIMSSRTRGVIVDPSSSPRGLVVLDLAIFLNYLRRFCVLPKGWRHLRNFSLYRAAFLRGYQLEGAKVSAKLLIIVEAMDLLSFLNRLSQKTANPAKIFYLELAYLILVRRILKS